MRLNLQAIAARRATQVSRPLLLAGLGLAAAAQAPPALATAAPGLVQAASAAVGLVRMAGSGSPVMPRSRSVAAAWTSAAVTPPGPGPAGPLLPSGDVTPVAAVDLERYAGFWYEIARVPAWFQSRCARRSVAVYGRRADGGLSVLNQCLKRNGNVEQAEGIARVVDPRSRARLQVSLVSLLGWRPFWGDYWVIGLDPDYRWAVVGDPRRRYGWILSRTPSLQPATLNGIFELLERNGYRRSRFVLTPQSP